MEKRVIYISILVAILSLIIPLDSYLYTLMTTVVIYSIAAVGLNLLLGYAGQISLGHAAFLGLGAYLSAYITTDLGLPFIIGLLVSGFVPVLLGIVLGLVALRLEGHYLAIATLGFGVTIQQTFKVLTGFTNGFAGKIATEASIMGMSLGSGVYYFIFSLIILTLVILGIHRLLQSKTGRAFIAMRDSEHAASAMGINIVKYKLIAFSISAFTAGIAGSIYMHLVMYTQPDVWGVTLSINLLAMVVIGGIGSLEGSVFGAGFIVFLPKLIEEIPVINEIPSSALIITGVLIVIVIRSFPLGILHEIYEKIKEVRNVTTVSKESVH